MEWMLDDEGIVSGDINSVTSYHTQTTCHIVKAAIRTNKPIRIRKRFDLEVYFGLFKCERCRKIEKGL